MQADDKLLIQSLVVVIYSIALQFSDNYSLNLCCKRNSLLINMDIGIIITLNQGKTLHAHHNTTTTAAITMIIFTITIIVAHHITINYTLQLHKCNNKKIAYSKKVLCHFHVSNCKKNIKTRKVILLCNHFYWFMEKVYSYSNSEAAIIISICAQNCSLPADVTFQCSYTDMEKLLYFGLPPLHT